MSKINLHPTDRIATFQEVSKQIGMFTVVLSIFIFAFFIPMSQGMATSQTCDDTVSYTHLTLPTILLV